MPRVTVVPIDGVLDPRSHASVEALPVAAEVAPLDEATGELLLFLGRTDVLVGSGVRALHDALASTGSDAAVGTADAGGVAGALLSATTGTTVALTPALLEHQTVAAVLWRRAAWDRLGLTWPVDGPRRGTMAGALAAAASVDLVPEPVTAEQARPPRLRRSHHHLRAEDLGDVLAEIDDLAAVGAGLPAVARAHWFGAVLEPALRAALPGLAEADDDVRRELVGRVSTAVGGDDPAMLAGLPAVTRLTYHLASRGLVAEVAEVVTAERSGALRLRRWVADGEERLADLPFRDGADLAVPRDVFRLDGEIDLRGRVEGVRWQKGLLHVEGHAYLRLVDIERADRDRLELALVRGTDGRRIELPVERVLRPDVTVRSRDPYSYDWAGFRTVLDSRLLRDDQGWSPATWRLEATVTAGSVSRTRNVAATTPGGARHPALHEPEDAAGAVRLVPVSGRGTFAVEVEYLPAVITRARVTKGAEGTVVLTGRLRRRTRRRSTTLTLRRLSGAEVLQVPVRVAGLAGRRFTAKVPTRTLLALAADDLEGQAAWSARFTLPGVDRRVPLRAASDLAPARAATGRHDVEVSRTANGRVEIAVRRAHPVVDGARWDGDTVELVGSWPSGLDGTVVLAARRTARDRVLEVQVAGGRFVLRLSPAAMPTVAGDLPLPYGTWLLLVRPDDDARAGEDGEEHGVPLAAEPGVLARLPMEHAVGTKPFTVTEEDGDLVLEVGPDLRDDERGPVNQHRLRWQDFPAFLRQGVRDEVLFESYESRAYGDNARAIYEELRRRVPGLPCRWMVVDGQTALPDGLQPVRRYGRDHFEALARARYVVVPNYRPMEPWFETPDAQVVVQTWHGAPFKRIALDNPRWDAMTTQRYTEMIKGESARWDYLVSPNPPSSHILRGAFGFEGELLETGYPRTDVFHAPDREERAAAVRRSLGLDADVRVVLYAPTMRDDHRYSGNRYSLDMQLDLEAARRELADDHVLLVRRHAKVVDSVPGVDGSFALDVSSWPDVNELLLATDILVSDYSSLMFDFAVTGRPMLFFSYDLADYRDRLRGFYFDPERQPGPHLATSAEVVAAIRDIDAACAAHADTYAAFRADFTPWDDGHAAQRLVDRVFREHL